MCPNIFDSAVVIALTQRRFLYSGTLFVAINTTPCQHHKRSQLPKGSNKKIHILVKP